jgi:hypothetical protein
MIQLLDGARHLEAQGRTDDTRLRARGCGARMFGGRGGRRCRRHRQLCAGRSPGGWSRRLRWSSWRLHVGCCAAVAWHRDQAPRRRLPPRDDGMRLGKAPARVRLGRQRRAIAGGFLPGEQGRHAYGDPVRLPAAGGRHVSINALDIPRKQLDYGRRHGLEHGLARGRRILAGRCPTSGTRRGTTPGSSTLGSSTACPSPKWARGQCTQPSSPRVASSSCEAARVPAPTTAS